jgi:hypothetical protein
MESGEVCPNALYWMKNIKSSLFSIITPIRGASLKRRNNKGAYGLKKRCLGIPPKHLANYPNYPV